MKSTGIVRKLDQLGRIVLPMELRRTLKLKEKDPVEIFVEGDSIILRKYTPGGCNCCSETENLITIYGVSICPKCLESFNSSKEKIMDSIK